MSHKLNRIDPNVLQHNPRCTLNAWKKYEALAIAAFNQHPRPYVFHPTTMSPATVASRFRDAVRGAIAFGYDSVILADELLRWYGETVIKHDKENVYIGPPTKVLSVLSANEGEVSQDQQFTTATFEEVSAFALLLSSGKLHGPIIITSPPDLTLFSERPNVEMIVRSDGSLLLL